MLIDIDNAIRQCTSKKKREFFATAIKTHVAQKDTEIERLREALTDILDNEGGRGTYDAMKLFDAKQRAETLLSESRTPEGGVK